MTLAHVAVGSNIDPHVHVPRARDHLAKRFGSVVASPFYITAAIGRPLDPPYWNGIFRFVTQATTDTTRAALREIEAAEGRTRGDDPYASRTLDLDLLLWNGNFIDPSAAAETMERPWLALSLSALEPDLVLDGRPLSAHTRDLETYPVAPFP